LSRAYLSRADLSGANLSGADLSYANLSDANLSDANLSDADLSYANLSRANLSGADLSGADLSGANLSGATLSGAALSYANLSGANLSGAAGADGVPRRPVAGLAARVLDQIELHPNTHDQAVWHSECGTRHCCAGWAVVLAGDVGAAAERRLGTRVAAELLLGGSDHPFGASDDPIPWLREMAAR